MYMPIVDRVCSRRQQILFMVGMVIIPLIIMAGIFTIFIYTHNVPAGYNNTSSHFNITNITSYINHSITTELGNSSTVSIGKRKGESVVDQLKMAFFNFAFMMFLIGCCICSRALYKRANTEPEQSQAEAIFLTNVRNSRPTGTVLRPTPPTQVSVAVGTDDINWDSNTARSTNQGYHGISGTDLGVYSSDNACACVPGQIDIAAPPAYEGPSSPPPYTSLYPTEPSAPPLPNKE